MTDKPRVILDANATMVANGSVQLKDLNGRVTRADRFEAPPDFRDAFVQSLRMATEDAKRIVPPPR